MEQRKVNWKNVSIVLLVGAIGIIIGFLDRVVNHVGPLENVIAFFASANSAAHQISPESAWYNTSITLASTAQSGFSMFGIVVIVIAGVAVMMTLLTACRYSA